MAEAEDIIHVDFERADSAKRKVTLSNDDVTILEQIKHRQLDMLYPALNRYQGKNINYLLENLALTIQSERPKDGEKVDAGHAFRCEYHNGQIVRLTEQHAKPGFDFDALATKILEATGKQTRHVHVLNAKDNAQERWDEEAASDPKVVAFQQADSLRASMK